MSTAAATPSRLSAKARALSNLQFSHAMVLKFISDIPADKALVMYGANAENIDGHALWQVGHLAATYAWFIDLLEENPEGPALPEKYNKLFGGGSKPTTNAADYPSFDEVKAALDTQYARFLTIGSRMAEEDFEKTPLKETGGFCPDRLSAFERAAFHNGWHVGQISSCRKAIGLKPAMG